jgi:uncharacterized protein (DUF885 family)
MNGAVVSTASSSNSSAMNIFPARAHGGRLRAAKRTRTTSTRSGSSSLDLTPDQIHKIGLSEVDRISTEMDDVMKQVGFKGDRAAFFSSCAPIRASMPGLGAAAARGMDREAIDESCHVQDDPRLPYTVEPVPPDIAPEIHERYVGPPRAAAAELYWVAPMLQSRPLYSLGR